MKVIVVGNGIIGSAVQQTLRDHGHDVVDIGRTRGTYKADTTNIDELRALFPVLTPFDAVANAAGDAFLVPLTESTDAQWAASIHAKGMGQINLVRAALPHLSWRIVHAGFRNSGRRVQSRQQHRCDCRLHQLGKVKPRIGFGELLEREDRS
jgi:nucleoside-diphosphate-sugar epimerase